MKYQFLGTAAAEGTPGLFCECEICEKTRELGGKNIRTRSQSVIDDTLLIDFSADTYHHILTHGLKLHKIYHCIITHNHSDHFYPHDLVMRIDGYAHLEDNSPFNLYGTSATIKTARSTNDIILAEERGNLILHEIKPFETFEASGYKITALPADHGAPESVIYHIEKDGKSVLHANDTGYFKPETWEWLKKNVKHIDFAEFDCTYGLEEHRENHMGFNTVIEVRDRLKKAGLIDDTSICVANHYSHNVGPLYEDMKAVSEKNDMLTSYDGMTIEF